MTTTLNYLLLDLRLHLGDTDSTSYRYLDEWLLASLVLAVKTLARWWTFRYLVNDNSEIYRNPNYVFDFAEPPVIQIGDERPIILMAAIIIKEGSLENSSWSTGSWRDAEIAYSNIEGNRAKLNSLGRDWEELKDLIKPPTERLAKPQKGSLPGYIGNTYERDSKY